MPLSRQSLSLIRRSACRHMRTVSPIATRATFNVRSQFNSPLNTYTFYSTESQGGQEQIDPQSEQLQNAFKEAKENAESGNTDSQVDVGIHYLSGTGCDKDADQALHWFQTAAEGKNPKAQSILGIMYENGLHVSQDPQKAVEYFQMAADQNHPGAMVDLGRAYYSGHGVEKSMDKAFEFFQKSSDAKHPEGLFWLGAMYEQGASVEQNMDQAIDLYKQARDAGDEVAAQRLSELENQSQ